jgi:dihydroorotase
VSERLLLAGGRVVDPAQGLDAVRDLLIEDGRVAAVGEGLPREGVEVVGVDGRVVCPGFVDLRTHLRQPGEEEKETVASGTRAAAAGGFTAVCAMPGTDPVNDEAGITRQILELAARDGVVRVHPVGALSHRCRGEELAEYGDLKDAGCVAVADDEHPVASPRLLRRALEYASAFELPVVDWCQEATLAAGGVMNEGPVSTRLGLFAIPAAAEVIAIERDLLLAELTGGRLHLARLSAAGSVEAVRRAKRRGVRVTAEVTPHHLVLTDAVVAESGYDSATRFAPPLRGEADRQALLAGLRDGTIDCIATDHAPHTVDDKDVEFDAAAPGASGLETAVAVCLDRLVAAGELPLPRLVECLSTAPARAFGLPGGSLAVGAAADVTVLDLERSGEVSPARFASRGRSTPFAGWTLKGGPVLTLVGGRRAFAADG